MESKSSVVISVKKKMRYKITWGLFYVVLSLNRSCGVKFKKWFLSDIDDNFERYFKVEVKN
jgi:hypothetical protein